MFEVAEFMIHYIYDKELSKIYLSTINLPKSIVFNLPEKEDWNNETILNLRIYLEDLADNVIEFLFQQYKNFSEIEEIKLGKILKKFNLPICPFWLEFVEHLKFDFTEGIYT